MTAERTEPPSTETLLEARRAVEAVLLVATDPTPVNLLAQLVELPVDLVDAMCRELAAEYDDQRRGFQLAEVAGGWRYQTHPDTHAYVERYALEGIPNRLSSAALETLAIVAYKQPISRAQIGAIRGVSVDGVLKTLEQRGYVVEVGKDPGPGQATLFGTSTFFLEQLGINALEDLPALGEFVPSADVLEALEQTLKVDGDTDPVVEGDAEAIVEDDAGSDVVEAESEPVTEGDEPPAVEATEDEAEQSDAGEVEPVVVDEGEQLDAGEVERSGAGEVAQVAADDGDADDDELVAVDDTDAAGDTVAAEDAVVAEDVAAVDIGESDDGEGGDEGGEGGDTIADPGAEVAEPPRFPRLAGEPNGTGPAAELDGDAADIIDLRPGGTEIDGAATGTEQADLDHAETVSETGTGGHSSTGGDASTGSTSTGRKTGAAGPRRTFDRA
jgi:segregation and condensation protein B